MIVCIAEKPSVAKDIARIIGANKAHDGYMEGNGYQVTWTFGHLCELKEPDDYTPIWKRWSLSALPMIPQRFGIKLINDEGIKRQFGIIEQLMQAADSIINCGDAGQEGELIQRWVMQKAQAKCPVKRLWISSMTDEAIRQGFQELKDQSEYQPLYLAGLSRAIGDWILGMNATRLYTLKYGQNRQVLSIGRVQTPTLALIVNRQKEIDNFEPEPYWVLATIYRDTQFTATSGKFTSKEEGEKAFSTIAGKPFNVTAVTKKKGTEAPPHLYDLTSLQVDCNKKFSYSADMTLKLIQSLYEKKFTTYPRVDTLFLTDDIYPKCPQILNGVSQAKINSLQKYLPLIQQLAATGKKLPKSKKVFDNSKVTDHHAIIPTGVPAGGMSEMEEKVYDLIARRFIAAFHPDCLFNATTVMGQVADVKFKATGKVTTDPGWKVVMGQSDSDNTQDKDRQLPDFRKGESGPHTPDLAEKIVEAAVGAAHVPVTVKIRKGFYAENRNAATFAQMLEGAGASAVAVHGRCATQLYTGQADWSVVDEVADAVEIPVIGSGDVFCAEDAAEHLRSSGASAVFIARGIYGNPWVFGDARALALDGTPVPSRSSVERLEALREHLTLTHELLPLMSRARTYASWYLKGMPHAAAWRAQVVRCSTYEEFMALVDEIERDVVACEAALAAGESVPPHPLGA